ncbi:MAG TPA: hypothetical protein VN081_00335, partial [Dongiaceae bacterium]|nr:hypothetical protein [Dongiaceae bacterium]
KIKRSLWVGGFAAIACLVMVVVVGTVMSTAHAGDPDKVYVCKYVGTPHVDERLQTGQNPIEVSVNAIQQNEWNGQVPGWFSDAHDRSYVLGYVVKGQPEPSVSECPAPESPRDASLTVSLIPATCTTGEKAMPGDAVNAKWDKNYKTVIGPATYSFSGTADAGHLFSDGTSVQTKSETLSGPLHCDATALLMASTPTCFVPGFLEYGATTHATFTSGTADGTAGIAYPSHYSVTATADTGHYFAGGVSTLTVHQDVYGILSGEQCEEQQPPVVVTAGVSITPATCTVGQVLNYTIPQHTTVTITSTANGTAGAGAGTAYKVTFVADNGYAFKNSQNQFVGEMVFSDTLAGPSTAPNCETGTVLGSATTTPGQTTTAPAVLPETDGEAGTAVIFGGSLLGVIAAAVGIRRLTSRGL